VDAPTCRPDELVADVAPRAGDERQICVVTNETDVVLGLFGRQALRAGERVSADPNDSRRVSVTPVFAELEEEVDPL